MFVSMLTRSSRFSTQVMHWYCFILCLLVEHLYTILMVLTQLCLQMSGVDETEKADRKSKSDNPGLSLDRSDQSEHPSESEDGSNAGEQQKRLDAYRQNR